MNTINPYITSAGRLGNKSLYTNTNYRNNGTYINRDSDGYSSKLGELQSTRYFSGVDAEIYFGDVYIDEAVNINFNLQQNTLPIFGYNSYVFDTCAQGSRLIQGSFTVNFTKSNYLYEVLNTLSVIDSGATLSKINHACNNKIINKSKRAAMWDKCFDIVLSYGNCRVVSGGPTSSSVNLSTMVILRGVYLIGCEQEFGTGQPGGKGASTGGIPLYETYYFYARDIEYDSTLPDSPENNSIYIDDSEADILREPSDLITIESASLTYNRTVDSYKFVCDFSHAAEIQLPLPEWYDVTYEFKNVLSVVINNSEARFNVSGSPVSVGGNSRYYISTCCDISNSINGHIYEYLRNHPATSLRIPGKIFYYDKYGEYSVFNFSISDIYIPVAG